MRFSVVLISVVLLTVVFLFSGMPGQPPLVPARAND
jgi:hypothetical protein